MPLEKFIILNGSDYNRWLLPLLLPLLLIRDFSKLKLQRNLDSRYHMTINVWTHKTRETRRLKDATRLRFNVFNGGPFLVGPLLILSVFDSEKSLGNPWWAHLNINALLSMWCIIKFYSWPHLLTTWTSRHNSCHLIWSSPPGWYGDMWVPSHERRIFVLSFLQIITIFVFQQVE